MENCNMHIRLGKSTTNEHTILQFLPKNEILRNESIEWLTKRHSLKFCPIIKNTPYFPSWFKIRLKILRLKIVNFAYKPFLADRKRLWVILVPFYSIIYSYMIFVLHTFLPFCFKWPPTQCLVANATEWSVYGKPLLPKGLRVRKMVSSHKNTTKNYGQTSRV